MSLSSSFNLLSFQRKVGDALKAVERTLELERSPRLAGDVEHTYGAKYLLVNLSSNAAIIAYMNCFEKLGLDASVLKKIDKTKPATLRFEASATSEFMKEVVVDVPANRSYETTEETKGSITKKVFKAVHHAKEFHHDVDINWTISIYSGTVVEEKKIIMSRSCKTNLITQSKDALNFGGFSPIELSLTWLLKQIDTDGLTSQFKVDTEDKKTKTPRRNEAVDKAVEFGAQLSQWSDNISRVFVNGLLRGLLQERNPAVPNPHDQTIQDLNSIIRLQHTIFNPILPLMEDSKLPGECDENIEVVNKSILALHSTADHSSEEHEVLLSSTDISKLLNEHGRTLKEEEREKWSTGNDRVLSSSEVTLSIVLKNLRQLSTQYSETVGYVEELMESQLIAAIGKRLAPDDLETFVKYHNARLLSPMPQPFSHAIRRPEHYPVGLLSIESNDDENDCIHSHSREVNAASTLKVPLGAATTLELTGSQHLHGWMNHRFGGSSKNHQLVARARQFSSFILVLGNMVDGSTLSPKDAIIVQNKDELLIPLLLEELPTAKEFKDAVKSLSPEQQRFARAYRSMQLSSSVFGICIVQIKPQLEALLGLPADSLDKEMKLTQDLMELFVEYQVPSDLLSYNGYSENASVEDKISNVRDNVRGVLGVIEAEKDKQLKSEQAKTVMAIEQRIQKDMPDESMSYQSYDSDSYQSYGSDDAPMAFDMSRGISYCMDEPQPERFRWAPRISRMSNRPPQQQRQMMAMRMGRGGGGTSALATASAMAHPPPTLAARKRTASLAQQQRQMMAMRMGGGGGGTSALAAASAMAHPPPTLAASKRTASLAPEPMVEASQSLPNLDGTAKVQCDQPRNQEPERGGDKGGRPRVPVDEGVDFTLIPNVLDSAVEKSEQASALRSTTIKTNKDWVRNRQDNLLSSPKRQNLVAEDIKAEKNKAFDLLDALSRSGSLPIAYSELHVMVVVTHCFEKDVMSTVVCDNINPIEKLEESTLLLASAVHGLPARDLVKDASELQRLEGTLPLLLKQAENDHEGD